MAKRTKTDPKAEATKVVAKAASKAIDSVNAVGRFLERVFGGFLEDTVALGGDWLRAYRLKRLADMQVKVDEHLARKGITATETISPRIGYKLIEAASLEDDEALHDKFARLLAEALDPNGERITRRHADVMTELTSQSLLVLDYCWKRRHEIGHVFINNPNIKYEPTRNDALAVRKLHEVTLAIKVSEDDLRHLIGLGLFKPSGDEFSLFGGNRSGMSDVRIDEPFERVTIYGDIEAFEFTEFGLSFCRAVMDSGL